MLVLVLVSTTGRGIPATSVKVILACTCLCLCLRLGHAKAGVGGKPVETSIWEAGDFAPETAIMEADDVAHSMGGKAFAAIPFSHSTSEIFLLQGVGDPELKCEQEEEEEIEELNIETTVNELHSAQVRIELEKALKAAGCGGQQRMDSSLEVCDKSEALRAELAQTVTMMEKERETKTKGESGRCRRAENFEKLEAGRLRAKLVPSVLKLLNYYSYGGHWFLEPKRMMCEDAGSCNWTLELRACSQHATLAEFLSTAVHLRLNDVHHNHHTAASPAQFGPAALAQLAFKTLDFGGKLIADRQDAVHHACFPYLFASAAYHYVRGSPRSGPLEKVGGSRAGGGGGGGGGSI
jgi:hypothetical protein